LPSAKNLVGVPRDVPLFEMRLERKGNKLIASIGANGDDGHVLWSDDLPDSWPDELEVGVVAVSSSKEVFTPVFRNYSLKPADAN
jgi:regulation of enolase protein 1 (concanavalin A-like superfamily)